MAQITEIKIVCDECLRTTGEQIEATEYQRGRSKFALCEEHYIETLERLDTLLEYLAAGKSPKAPKKPSTTPAKAAADVSCTECGEKFLGKNYKRPKQALNMHMRNHHAA